jgi:hypothetical protein
LQIRLVDGVVGDAIEDVKTAIIDRLWHASTGPTLCTCSIDRELEPHPRTMLHGAPGGPYTDDRSLARQLWHLVRFWTGQGLRHFRVLS